MAEIDSSLISRVLYMYKPEQRFLTSASVDYPSAKGKFSIGSTYYAKTPLKHVTDVEIQLCLNQLTYASVAALMENKQIPELAGLNFFDLQNENMLSLKSEKNFRKLIDTSHEITGEIKFNKHKKYRGLFISNLDFKFENGRCFGSLESAIVLPK